MARDVMTLRRRRSDMLLRDASPLGRVVGDMAFGTQAAPAGDPYYVGTRPNSEFVLGTRTPSQFYLGSRPFRS